MTINLVHPFKEVIVNQISELYVRFHQLIKTTSDWRIADKKIEVILAVGEVGLIKDFYMKLANIKEVNCSIHELIIE